MKSYILIAEDDRFYANIYTIKLTKEGYDVAIVENGQEALDKIKQKVPSLLLLDLVMPVMDGYQTLEAIHKDKTIPKFPILVLTNLSQDDDIARALSLGATDYIVKTNVSIQEVIAKIKTFFRPSHS
jgi:DNA-binding response OmpR family regulator